MDWSAEELRRYSVLRRKYGNGQLVEALLPWSTGHWWAAGNERGGIKELVMGVLI